MYFRSEENTKSCFALNNMYSMGTLQLKKPSGNTFNLKIVQKDNHLKFNFRFR